MNKLDELFELYAQRDAIALSKRELIDSVIPVEVRAAIGDIESEFQPKEIEVIEKIEQLEASIKTEAIAQRSWLDGQQLMCVFRQGGKQVQVDDVLRIADRFEKTVPEVSAELRGIITLKKDSAVLQVKKGL